MWDLAQKIDWRSLASDEELLPAVEHDPQAQLQTKALVGNYLGKTAESTRALAEEA